MVRSHFHQLEPGGISARSRIAPAEPPQPRWWLSSLTACSVLMGLGGVVLPAQGQSITPATDGTGTAVIQIGDTYQIQGGTVAGQNLFHSFQQFGLTAAEVAAFLADPTTQNIFARVIGGDPSQINGLLTVLGGSPNFYLINPAGIVLGANAQLDVPGNFFATTATALEFGHGTLFAYENNQYSDLVGNPLGFHFSPTDSGAVINSGNLAVNAGQQLGLTGRTVLNTGTLTAPGGTVQVMGVPDAHYVRISQPGMLLSLEVDTQNLGASAQITALDLPALLTGSPHITGAKADSDHIYLENSDLAIPSTSGLVVLAGEINTQDATGDQGRIRVDGDRLALINATLDASGAAGGGDMHIGKAAQRVFIDANSRILANTTGPEGDGGNILIWSNESTVASGTFEARGGVSGGDGGFIDISSQINLGYDGNADLSAPQGQAGTLLFDPRRIFIGATSTDNSQLPNIFKDTDPLADYFISTTALNALTGTVVLEAIDEIVIQDTLNLASSSITFRADSIVAQAAVTGQTIIFDGLSIVSLQDLVTATNLSLKANGIFVENINSGSVGIQATNLSIAANGSAINSTVQGSGTLSLNPFSPDRSLVIGGTIDTPAWDLHDSEVQKIHGFGTTVVGRPGNTGSLSFIDNAITQNFLKNTNLTVNGMGNLQGFNKDTTWTLTGTGQGQMNNGDIAVNFNNVGRLTGGSGRDTFVFNPGINFGGILDGGTGLGTLDYSNYQGPALVNLLQNQATGTTGVFNIDTYIAAPGGNNSNIIDPPKQLPPVVKDVVSPTPPPELNELHSNPTANPGSNANEGESDLVVGDRRTVQQLLDGQDLEGAIASLDQFFAGELLNYLGKGNTGNALSFGEMQDILKTRSEETGLASALIYIFLRPEHIDLILIPPTAKPIHYVVPVAKTDVLATVQRLRQEIGDPVRRMTVSYLPPAQQLHQWLIAPMQADLDRFGLEALLFSVDSGLHTLPMAALHSGEGFLMENYNLSMVPSLSLTQTQRTNLNQASMFAMGVSDFVMQPDLPAVPTELTAIAATQTETQTLLNHEVTLSNWQTHQGKGADIVHLATHAEFRPGAPDQSYIQLWDQQISMADLQSIPWREQGVNLLVLSACRTAFGSAEAEFGFAGIAVSTGVQSAVASIWPANDVATLALMQGFYQHLTTAPTKAEALRQAQLDLLNRKITLDGGQLVGSGMALDLPPALQKLGDRPFHHPYYWSGFALIGSPW